MQGYAPSGVPWVGPQGGDSLWEVMAVVATDLVGLAQGAEQVLACVAVLDLKFVEFVEV